MLTITITFAVLVALWGFSGTIVTLVRRGLTHAQARPRPVRERTGPARRRRTPPVALPTR